jgi:hypothetical protein
VTSASTEPGLATAAQAVAEAERLTSVAGPWVVGDVETGTYSDLWQGSTDDPRGDGAAEWQSKQAKVVWRVDLTGPHGIEELYLDRASGALLDAITQGD